MDSKHDEKTILYLKQLYEEESGRLEVLEKKYNTLYTEFKKFTSKRSLCSVGAST